MEEPNIKKEEVWSIFKCMFALCMMLCLGLCGLFAFYMHGSFNATAITAEMNQIENNNSTQSVTNG